MEPTSLPKTPPHLVEHLADTVFEPMEEIARRAQIWGLQAELAEGTLTLVAPPAGDGQGFVAGFGEDIDPVNKAIVLAFVLLGPWWPYVAPTLLGEVRRRWRNQLAGRGTTARFP